MERQIFIIGRGTCFDRRFLEALNAAEFTIAENPEQAIALIYSALDGEDINPIPISGIPSILLDSDTGKHQQVIKSDTTLSLDTSPELLVSELSSLLFETESRRRDPRRTAPIATRYTAYPEHGEAFMVAGELLNLSEGGAFVRTLHEVPFGTLVDLEIMSGDGDEPLILEGKVVHTVVADLNSHIVHGQEEDERSVFSHPGFAMKFAAMSPQQKTYLQHIIARI